jgi:predicted aspartyl protease
MQLILRDDLPFTILTIAYEGVETEVQDVLVDTGSATTVLAADIVASIGIEPEPTDRLLTIQGVGGTEVVFERKLEWLAVGAKRITAFAVEIGGMDYGFPINGILGMDFLVHTGAIINLRDMLIEFSD